MEAALEGIRACRSGAAMMRFPVISLPQPHAMLTALGLKQHIVKDAPTDYRGTILVYASSREMETPDIYLLLDLKLKNAIAAATIPDFEEFPFGAIIAKCELVDCLSTTDFVPSDWVDRKLDNYQVEKWAWKLSNPQILSTEWIQPQEPDNLGFWYYDLPEVAA